MERSDHEAIAIQRATLAPLLSPILRTVSKKRMNPIKFTKMAENMVGHLRILTQKPKPVL
ncbi:MAG: hypothetical protein LBQ54_13905 [Planctomycetaceae bacterium]|nr:hypothetical protein [Planctomycetaceae bacterium]